MLRALRAAHSAGVLHRDVKPGNVLLGRDGRVLLTDFGIAQIEGDSTITRTGEVVGSVDYLAPERVRGHDPGPASDLWALGATLYTAVEGRSPFRRTSPLSTMQAVVEEEAEQPVNAGPLGPVISALLRKEPERRPGAEEAEQMLAEAAEGRRPNAAQAYVPTQTSGLHGPGNTGGYGTPGQSPNGRAVNGSAIGGPATPVGPSPVGPTAVGPVPGGHGGGRPVRPRRRLRTLALVVAAAAVLGGGAAVGFQEWNNARHDSAAHDGTNPGPASSASPGGDQDPDTGTVPDSWETHHDPLGFSISLPKGWKRQVYGINGPLKQIDYTPDDGKHFVRISIDTSPDFADAYEHQKDLEQQLQRLVGYQRVALKQNVYRDRNGSLWEYTWNALKKDPPYVAGPRHAVEETYFSREGTEYALYMSGPADDWPKTGKQFKWVLQSWQQPGQTR
ncbi:serine/threonine protein kinase [Streptomyces sp. S816]|nr:serine/threonine protein kinase [Streptomyces sp. S816]